MEQLKSVLKFTNFYSSFFCCCFCCMEKKKLFPEPDMKMLNSNMILGHDEYELNSMNFKIYTVKVFYHTTLKLSRFSRRQSEVDPPIPTWGTVQCRNISCHVDLDIGDTSRTNALNYAAIIMHSSCALIDTSKLPESSSTNLVSINYVFKTNTE